MTEFKTYRIRVLNKDENKTKDILSSLESRQFAIINQESFSRGSLYEVTSSKKPIATLRREFKDNKINAIIRFN